MDTSVSIYLNHFCWGSYFSNGQAQLGMDLQHICDELVDMSAFPEPHMAEKSLAWRGRLLKRLLLQLPWEREGAELWLNGDPWARHEQWPGPGFELQVPKSRLDEVMRILLPLVRQLRVHMAIPVMNLYFESYSSVQPGTEAQLSAWDPDWSRRGFTAEQREAYLAHQLAERLTPMGFEFVPKSKAGGLLCAHFRRPLAHGGGFQGIEMVTGFRLRLAVYSDRSLEWERQRGIRPPTQQLFDDSVGGKVLGCALERLSDYPFDTVVGEEDALWLMEEFDRVLLPLLDHLHTAQDLYDWYFDPKWRAYSVTFGVAYAAYAARLLPNNEEFLRKVDGFRRFGNMEAEIKDLLRYPAPSPDDPL